MAGVAADQDWDWYIDIPRGRAGVGPRHHRPQCARSTPPRRGPRLSVDRVRMRLGTRTRTTDRRPRRPRREVGPYNGHLTNASAYGRDDLADVIYHRIHRTGG
jgi:hypothetical protein